MKLYEFEAKEVFKERGIQIPKGVVAKTPYEAKKIAESIGKPVAIKAQVLTGRRGRAGLIKFSKDPKEVENIASNLLTSQLSGSRVASLLIEEKMDIAKELYVSITIDGAERKIVLITSLEGGMELEEIAVKFPEKIIKEYVDILIGLQGFQIRKLIKKMGIRDQEALTLIRILESLYNVFIENDATLAEINPLVITKEGLVVAVDARLNIDEFVLHRHPKYKAIFEERKNILLDSELREWKAAKSGIGAYVELEGDIGVMSNGASLGMETIDLVSDLGGKLACFCDIGGMLTVEVVENSMDLVLSNPRVQVLLLNILGGLVQCDVIAEGIVNCIKRQRLKLPIIVRLSGTLEDEGRNILRSVGIEAYDSVFEATKKTIEKIREIKK